MISPKKRLSQMNLSGDKRKIYKELRKMNGNSKMTNVHLTFPQRFFIIVFFVVLSIMTVAAQSTSQSFPTPIAGNEISGQIPARDIGDARLTSYFYTFNGTQGDVFINVVTSNLNGDIDIFTADNLKPLTKVTIYSDVSQNETGRVIYLRKPEKLILRIEGRTPNDDPATFRIKFAGSFAPSKITAENEVPDLPEVKAENQGDIKVNSVGTIIAVEPKPTPTPKETTAKNESKPGRTNKKPITKNSEENAAENKDEEVKTQPVFVEKEIIVTVTENKKIPGVIADEQATEERSDKKPTKIVIANETEVQTVAEIEKPKENNEENPKTEAVENSEAKKSKSKSKKETKAKAPNPLDNVHLTVLFKDGTKIEHQMSDVFRMNVDKGILTIITNTGKIGRYSILDVEKMTIE